ncbi:MAG: redoxin domain-containing protein [Candidatus Levybacteria bacterium]|nr:redoxin domain-containing protein [Candidatus Levybacteria bacterium]
MPALRLFILLFLLLGVFMSLVAKPALAVSCDVVGSSASVGVDQTGSVTIGISNVGEDSASSVRFLNPDTGYMEFTGGSATGWNTSANGGEITFSGGSIPGSQTVTFTITISGLVITEEELQIDGFASSDGSSYDQCYASSGVSVVLVSTPTPTPTSAPGATATPTPKSSSSSSSTATPTPTPKPTDKTAPFVTIDLDFSKPFREGPRITGEASDTGLVNPGIAKVEYSTDGGKNWIPVDKFEAQSTKLEANSNNKNPKSFGFRNSNFEFTPSLFEDGNYQIKARAIDLSGNIGSSKSYTLVIDRLPPEVGGTFISFGPQGLQPDVNGTTYLLKGLDQKITLSSVGGPTVIEIKSQKLKVKNEGQNAKDFKLTKNADSGLWSGVLSFEEAGNYSLTANSLDGASNTTKRVIGEVTVLDTGRVKFGSQLIKDAEVSVFYYDPVGKQFVLWDGKAYSQSNPQKTTADGDYMLFLPSGSYYLEVRKGGFRTFRSDIFKLNKSSPINGDIVLEKARTFTFFGISLPIPDFEITTGEIKTALGVNGSLSENQKSLLGKEIPEADLFEGTKVVKTLDFRGKPYLVAFINTWHPASSEQIKILEKLSDSGLKVVTIFPQESASKIALYKKRGGYSLPMYADPDGTLVTPLNLQSLPTHVFLDRKGIITGIKKGILSAQEITSNF